MNVLRGALLVLCIMVLAFPAMAQQYLGAVKGVVTTADNQPAEGVTILIKNTARNTVADNNGSFEIKNLQPGNYTLLVSLIGHQDAETEVAIESGKATAVSLQLTLSNK